MIQCLSCFAQDTVEGQKIGQGRIEWHVTDTILGLSWNALLDDFILVRHHHESNYMLK